jgi:cold shock CspA family protein
MKATTTNFPLQITFRNMKPQPETEMWIRAEAARLETFYKRIMGCRVAVESPHRRHEVGSPYHLRIDITVPGGELVIRHEPSLKTRARQVGAAEIKKQMEVRTQHKHLRQAIHDAFKAAGRRLQDYGRRQRGEVKTREPRPLARVSRLFPKQGYGFLATPDGRELYFHRDSVLYQAFGRLKAGSMVSFAEEQGEKGPQASTVRLSPRKGARGLAERSAA